MTVETVGRTGVEMEALTAVSVGLLTVYDMCKAVDRGMRIEAVRLLEKTGGKSGDLRQPGGLTETGLVDRQTNCRARGACCAPGLFGRLRAHT